MKLGRPTLIYSILSFLNAGIAFMRDIFLAAFLGTGILADIFLISLRVPLSFRRSISEETFNSSFIPIFNELRNSNDGSLKYDFAKKILIILLTVFLIIVLLGEIFMPAIVAIFSNGIADQYEFELLVKTSRILFPYLLFIALSSVFIGILNSEKKFILSALLPMTLHLSIIISLFEYFDFSKTNFLSAAVLASGLIQTLILFFSVERNFWTSFSSQTNNTRYIKRFFQSVIPSISTSLLGQFNIIIGLIFASMQAGAISYLYYAERLYLLPLALIAIPISRVIIPSITNAIRSNNLLAAKEIKINSIKYLTVLIMPSTFCMFFLSDTLIQVFFERGEFNTDSSTMASIALKVFLIGLPPACFIKILTPYFFAIDKPKTPLKLGFQSSVINFCLIFALYPIIGYLAIPLAISIASWFNLLLYHMEYKKIDFLIFDSKLAKFFVKHTFLSMVLLSILFVSDFFLIDISILSKLLIQILLVSMIWITYIYNFDEISKDFFIKWFEIHNGGHK